MCGHPNAVLHENQVAFQGVKICPDCGTHFKDPDPDQGSAGAQLLYTFGGLAVLVLVLSAFIFGLLQFALGGTYDPELDRQPTLVCRTTADCPSPWGHP